MQETQVLSLSQEDPLAEAIATHSSILAWIIPWTEAPDGLESMCHKESDTTEQLHAHGLALCCQIKGLKLGDPVPGLYTLTRLSVVSRSDTDSFRSVAIHHLPVLKRT